ncbi:Bug family tripartite tricarboxylate transporter substrate binding protein [Bordetella sp. 02P26C-1]|uniref:Bug family tripartite tricarboxylate transporter substrate binding protein n=1 Tax=Bordetella sp. 02P26C-1 TaxID=2683195 RepID=UPI00135366BA|nr:tripartite tricarboxylate transporter substrate binding protein [Bordetella sp. 02P26C-1]MVW79488.1 tripartite tricarboxylate transporter substrate binding protein [Bordetella sp. 02P26C-1]
MKKTIGTALAAAALFGIVAASPARAAYPERPVKVVVAFTAGGTTDKLTRSTSEHLSQALQQSFIVENRPGAGGNIGTEYVVRSDPDGYTLIVDSVGPIAVNPSLTKLSYDPLTDLVPIVQIATVPNVLVVPPELPVKTFDEFLEYAKTKKSLNYGSTGVGTSSHLASHLLMQQLGAKDATHVPYKGADAINDLIAGRLDFMFATVPSVMGQIRAGKLRPLALSTKQRLASLPDLPTVAEKGFPDFDAGSWFGFFAPKNTPQEVVTTINKGVNDALPSLKEAMLSEGAIAVGGTPDDFDKFTHAEYEKWKKIVEQLGPNAQ